MRLACWLVCGTFSSLMVEVVDPGGHELSKEASSARHWRKASQQHSLLQCQLLDSCSWVLALVPVMIDGKLYSERNPLLLTLLFITVFIKATESKPEPGLGVGGLNSAPETHSATPHILSHVPGPQPCVLYLLKFTLTYFLPHPQSLPSIHCCL